VTRSDAVPEPTPSAPAKVAALVAHDATPAKEATPAVTAEKPAAPVMRIVNAPASATEEVLPEAARATSEPRRAAVSTNLSSYDPTAWRTEVVPTALGKRLATEQQSDRARLLRSQAYGLGAQSLASARRSPEARTLEIVPPAPQPVEDRTPWYLRKPSWSPFEGSAAYGR
jgi:hypothetical protein